ncbi:MAG: helix-turn-helix transcriptional regulator [Chthoniobacterales bacterium]|nr:helix-turn-helix transcriptional regulator [Chthoniobacterales bacterium]
MDESSTTLENRLRLAREQSGLSQGQAAKLMNLHRPTISEIEAGRRKVSTEEISAFARHYGVTVSWLLSEVEENDPVVELAARELSKLKKEDLNKFLRILRSMKARKG